MQRYMEDGVTLTDETPGLVARLGGDISIRNAANLHRILLEAWKQDGTGRALTVDLGNAKHIDSSGLGALLELVSDGVPLTLCNLQASPRRLLERTGLSNLFRIAVDCADMPVSLGTT